ncbi:hypothetical protein CEUSTIGMA_g684.t1 [Chlamydomonas eustigma]|uniref:Smr domain-containing protein n=1 Tax=Chlamydomonas eustigma TaxID=1157962 RepID=A0A250WR15_9CHLO|nr:hypothetical protein CEUSTIGMA_g684.t1 [Chlamydomonas eustigma]|eukprot:GAX73231.1 hypothetical protein CEUSTIGMA_g684.t1 [Chlamydomonas eustigma]
MCDTAKTAIVNVLNKTALDFPILEYLASMAAEAWSIQKPQDQDEALSSLTEALHDCLTHSAENTDRDYHSLAQAVLKEMATIERSKSGTNDLHAALLEPLRSTQDFHVPEQKSSLGPSTKLRASAASFTPQAFSPPISATREAVQTQELSYSVNDSVPELLQRNTAVLLGCTRLHNPGLNHCQDGTSYMLNTTYASRDDGTSSQLSWVEPNSPEEAIELMQLWFPDYSQQALLQLYTASHHSLWQSLEDLLLMEGEEPYENRQETTERNISSEGGAQLRFLNQAHMPDSGANLNLKDEESFPSLGGTGHNKACSVKVTAPLSARDALLSTHQSSTRSVNSVGNEALYYRQGTDLDEGKLTSKSVTQRRLPGKGAMNEGGHKGKHASQRVESVPTVASGAVLTRLYEEAREEAREHAYQRHLHYHQATKAYISGNRDLAGRLSAEARRLGQAMAAADARAASCIFRARNPNLSGGSGSGFLDLHGLHVKEACSLVSNILRQQLQNGVPRPVPSAQRGKLLICTGAGKHSDRRVNARGVECAPSIQGRLASAVERLLQRSGVQFTELQHGLFEVTGILTSK